MLTFPFLQDVAKPYPEGQQISDGNRFVVFSPKGGVRFLAMTAIIFLWLRAAIYCGRVREPQVLSPEPRLI